jgi:hypothetical protein
LIIAALASSAAVAFPAAAAEFHGEKAPAELLGNQISTLVFEISGTKVQCVTTKLTGSITSTTSKEITFTPKFEGCSAFGFATAHVNTTSCKLTVDFSSSKFRYTSCTPGSIDITPTTFGVSVCTVTLVPGSSNYDIDIEGAGSGNLRDLTLTTTATSIIYSEHGGACGLGSGLAKQSGSVTVKGFKEGTQIGIWVA